jgi:dipeptide/tripeptide permease
VQLESVVNFNEIFEKIVIINIFIISAILVVYLHTKLEFDQSSSTAIYHLNELFTFVFPLFGAILAESYCGLFKAIVTMCFVAFFGGLVVSLSTIGSISIMKM